jgi:hypothetical protein
MKRKLLFLIVFLLAVPTAATAKRLALAIGNDNYTKIGKLQKAGNDAELIGINLRKVGYEVTIVRDANYREMVSKIDQFISKIEAGDEIVFFYAGHGVQLKTGNYFLPVDLEAQSESLVEKTAYPLDDLMEKLNETKARFKLIIVDACRDNPLAVKGRSIGGARGLAPPEPPKGQMIIYSASRGQQALDMLSEKDKSPNGVFTRIFASKIINSSSPIDRIARSTQDEVESLAKTINHDQRPAIYNEARGDFYFINNVNIQRSDARSPGDDVESKFWQEVVKMGTPAAYRSYLNKYPNGIYTQLALINLEGPGKLLERPDRRSQDIPLGDPNDLATYLQGVKVNKNSKKSVIETIGPPKLITQNQDGLDVLIWEINFKSQGPKSRASLAITFNHTGNASAVNYRISSD